MMKKQRYDDYEDSESEDEFHYPYREKNNKKRIIPIRTSRIADRPMSDKPPTISIKIELDLEVEVEIYARVKGDVCIGLM